MAWLNASYAYRMSIPVANPTTAGDRAIDAIPFPAWFLKDQGHIVSATYYDVHVTTVNGTTELPCELNTAKNALYVDYASMPTGRSNLYVYYGRDTGYSAPTACTYYTPARNTAGIVNSRYEDGTLIDSGFEMGTDGSSLSDTYWTDRGSPAAAEYDDNDTVTPPIGSKCGKVTAGAGTGGIDAAISASGTGNELRFWMYVPASNYSYVIGDIAGAATTGGVWVRFSSDGTIGAYTNRTVTGYTAGAYTTVGDIGAGNEWLQFKVVLDYTNDTYTFSYRAAIGDSWTACKASGASDYNIPMRGTNDLTGMSTFTWQATTGLTFYLDDVRYKTSAITESDKLTSTTVQTMGANDERTSDDATAGTYYLWGSDLDMTYLDSSSPGYCSNVQTSYKCGFDLSGSTQSFIQTFEGADAGALPDGWADGEDSPQNTELDTAQKKNGSSSMWVKGPAALSYGGVLESVSAGMTTSDAAELRFWAYFDTANEFRVIQDAAVAKSFFLQFDSAGKIKMYTTRNVTGYTQDDYTEIATYAATTWTQYRIVFDFANGVYQFSSRTDPAGAWTQHKSASASNYDIPMYSSGTVTTTGGTRFQGMNGSDLWIDDFEWADWGIGTASNIKYHALVKFFEGGLPKGTVSDAKLHLYASALSVATDDTLSCYRNANVGHGSTYALRDIASGWGSMDDTPTWRSRLRNGQTGVFGTLVSWQTTDGAAGGTHADEFGTADPVTLSLTTSDTAGYKTLDLTSSWLDDWLSTDYYSQGLLIKATNEETDDCLLTITAPSQTESPVLEVAYSAFDTDQYAKRKVTTDTQWVTHLYAGERFISIPTADAFGVHTSRNCNQRHDFHYFDESGRIFRVIRDLDVTTDDTGAYHNHRHHYNGNSWGLHYDDATGRYWLVGSCANNSELTLAYSDPNVPTNWTWKRPDTPPTPAKSSYVVIDDVAHLVYYDTEADPNGVFYMTYTRTTDTWSAATRLTQTGHTGLTEQTLGSAILATDVMDGSGVITASGAVTDYQTFGAVRIDSEVFWYTGKDGSTLTGVTRDAYGTTAAAHSIGATVEMINDFGTYTCAAYDAVNACIHITYTCDIAGWVGSAAYTGIFYMRHYLADDADVWKDESGSALTLPLTSKTLRPISTSDYGAWNHNLLTLDDGTTLSTYGQQNDHDSAGGGAQSDAKVRRLNDSGLIDVSDMGFISSAVNMTDLSSGNVVFAGTRRPVIASNALQVYVARSADYGATIDIPTELADHSSITSGYLWEPTLTRNGNLGGLGMAAYHHLNYHGAVYFNSVEMIPAEPSDVVATLDNDHIDVTFTDNCTFEDGIKWKRSTDGGATYGDVTTIATPDTASFTDADPPTSGSVVYAVASYSGGVVSAYVESNTISLGGSVPVWLLRHHSNIDLVWRQ